MNLNAPVRFRTNPAEHDRLSEEEKRRYLETREFLLARGWTDVARLPLGPPESGASSRFLRTPGGHATLLYGLEWGQQGILHHLEAPDEKTREWWRRRLPEDPDLVVFHGMGLGYSIPEILERADRGVHFLIVEADPTTLGFLLALRDAIPLFRHPRVQVLLPSSAAEAASKTQDWLTQPRSGAGRARMFVDPPGMFPQPTFLREWYDTLAKRFPRMAETLARCLRNEYPHPTNLSNNWPTLQTRPGIGRLFNKMQGCPAVVVGAGPSLDSDLPLLREAQDRVLIVACDTSIRPLLNHGVRVDLGVAIDSSPRNHDHFKALPEAAFLPVLFGGVHPPLLEQYRDRAWIAATAPFPTVDLLEDLPGPTKYLRQKGMLVMNGSVGSAALDLAFRLGCSPVFLSGMDLAYGDGKDHARGTIYDQDGGFQDRQPGLFEVPSTDGGRVFTCAPFLVSLFGVVHQLGGADTVVYNLSSCGAAIPGTEERGEGVRRLKALQSASSESPRARLEVETELALRSGGRRRREREADREDSLFPIDSRGRLRAKPDADFRKAVFRDNLRALAARDPETARMLELSEGVLETGCLSGGETCEWLRNAEGFPRLAIRSAAMGATWLIAATDSPWEEAAEWRAKNSLEVDPRPLLLGAGLGFHLRELLDALPAEGTLWIWEPYPDRFILSLAVADFRRLFADARLHWAVGKSAEELFRAMERGTPEFLLGRPLYWRAWTEPSLRGWAQESEGEFLRVWFRKFGEIYPIVRKFEAKRASG